MLFPMHGRPHAAKLTVRCLVAGCTCTREVAARVTESSQKGQLIERDYEADCSICGHKALHHGTLKVEKGDVIERRRTPRR